MQEEIYANREWDNAIQHTGWQGMIQFCGSAFSMGAADKQAEIITV